MANLFPEAPTYADPVIVDEITGKSRFNPVWLRWFLFVSQAFSDAGGTGIQHDSLGGLQGGVGGEYFHLTNSQFSAGFGNKSANTVYAGPASGAAAAPAFRSLVPADIPGGTLTAGRVVFTGTAGILDASANLTWTGSGTLGLIGKLDITNDLFRLRTAKTPSTAGDTGNQGDICWDSTYIYVAVATNTWKRVEILTW